ncbi:hypothetical protein [Paenimyroides baculatum]|uniref:Uncharacterized protein n=1 Tax=Paenimyroides baculatum TaxID=2608000 RepID=A0A5M6CS60_9FLAO|nr:hypothetical protein [Paenimyroides baculatum]KAA5538034.1 hypothetical protein F0460_00035 [Paenimyroides baculatum]
MKNSIFLFVLVLLSSCCSSISDKNKKTAADSADVSKEVSDFRKNYGKEIYYNYSGEFNYSQKYLEELYLKVEYYVANSKNELLKNIIANKNRLEYSVEQQRRDEKEYTVLGIGTVTEGRITKAQWLFYDAENNILYEYDLPNDELVIFE